MLCEMPVMSRADSSLRRRAPTKPVRSRARSRRPARFGSGGRPRVFQCLTVGHRSRTPHSSGGIKGVDCSGGAECRRRIPFQKAMTRAVSVGSGRSAARWANLIADSLAEHKETGNNDNHPQ